MASRSNPDPPVHDTGDQLVFPEMEGAAATGLEAAAQEVCRRLGVASPRSSCPPPSEADTERCFLSGFSRLAGLFR